MMRIGLLDNETFRLQLLSDKQWSAGFAHQDSIVVIHNQMLSSFQQRHVLQRFRTFDSKMYPNFE